MIYLIISMRRGAPNVTRPTVTGRGEGVAIPETAIAKWQYIETRRGALSLVPSRRRWWRTGHGTGRRVSDPTRRRSP